MAFAPTPHRHRASAQLLPLSSITATAVQQSGGSSGSVAITSPPTSGTVGNAISLVGLVSPSATTVQVGLSTSSSIAPAGWTSATVSGTAWTASLTPSTAGIFYIWAKQTSTPSVSAVSAALTIAASSGSITITSPPATGTTTAALSLAGTVSPSGTAVRAGFSSSASVAPTSWTTATVSGTGWTASITQATAGTYYIWAEQTGTTSIQAVSAAVVISASGGSALSYSLIAGSGNASLTAISLVTSTTGSSPAVDWKSSIVHGSADVTPNVNLSGVGAIATGKFWFDTTNTGVTVGSSYGNALFNSSSELIAFYPFNTGYGQPTTAPAAPSTAGTYYGKYAFYDSSSNLLGVFTTSAITVI